MSSNVTSVLSYYEDDPKKKKTLLQQATDDQIQDVELELQMDSAFDFKPALGHRQGYFNKLPADHRTINENTKTMYLEIIQQGQVISPTTRLFYFFEDVDEPLTLDNDVMIKIMRVFRAVRDVSRDHRVASFEMVEQERKIHYSSDEFKLAQLIYTKCTENDIKTGNVTLDLVKLARDPMSALVNVTERKDSVEELGNKKLGEGDEEINIQDILKGIVAHDEKMMIQTGGYIVDKETVRQIALYKAINEGDEQRQRDIRNGRYNEDALTNYLCSQYNPMDLHKFPTRLEDLKKANRDHELAKSMQQLDPERKHLKDDYSLLVKEEKEFILPSQQKKKNACTAQDVVSESDKEEVKKKKQVQI